MQIPSELLNRCFRQGIECYPEEACGLLSGPEEGDGLSGFHPFPNELGRLHAEDPEKYPRGPREGYYLDPLAFLKLDRELRAAGQRIKVIFHSHPDVGAYFSEEDRDKALWAGRPVQPGIGYLVCGIEQGRPGGAILATFNEASGSFDITEVVPPTGKRGESPG